MAYLSDVMLTPEDIARLGPEQQALYAQRPAWSVAATAIAVWCGAAGCLALILGRRWALPLFALSLAGVVVQDAALFGMTDALTLAGPVPVMLQGFVFLVAVALLFLARKARQNGWLT